VGRAREALRPCGLFVSLSHIGSEVSQRISARCAQFSPAEFPAAFKTSIERSLAHLLDELQCPPCVIDVVLMEQALTGGFLRGLATSFEARL